VPATLHHRTRRLGGRKRRNANLFRSAPQPRARTGRAPAPAPSSRHHPSWSRRSAAHRSFHSSTSSVSRIHASGAVAQSRHISEDRLALLDRKTRRWRK
jgi:hypothetical protein